MRTILYAVCVAAALLSCAERGDSNSSAGESGERVQFDLGRPICGDCCVELVQRAFEGAGGVLGLEMHAGDTHFFVKVDQEGPEPEDLLNRLHAAGMRAASLSARPVSEKRWVTAR